MKKFKMTEIQAKAILDMRLQRLTGLERKKVEEEYLELIKLIATLKGILESKAKRMNIVKEELLELKKKYGDSIAFFGGIDQQELLPGGNIDKIREEIKHRCEILGKNGGYMLAPAHIIQSDTTPETVKVMIEAAKELGKYK